MKPFATMLYCPAGRLTVFTRALVPDSWSRLSKPAKTSGAAARAATEAFCPCEAGSAAATPVATPRTLAPMSALAAVTRPKRVDRILFMVGSFRGATPDVRLQTRGAELCTTASAADWAETRTLVSLLSKSEPAVS